MGKFSKEYLFRECVLHRHCILLRLKKAIKWDNDVVDEIYMVNLCLKEKEKEQMLLNIANTIDTYGMIEIKAFAGYESKFDERTTSISTNDINEIEFQKNK